MIQHIWCYPVRLEYGAQEGGGVGQGHEKETNSQNQQNVVEIIKNCLKISGSKKNFFPNYVWEEGQGRETVGIEDRHQP